MSTKQIVNNLTSSSTINPLSANQGRILNNKINPVGSVIVTPTNTNPSGTYGGTWTLIDKEFASTAAVSGGFTINSTNCSSHSCYWSRAGHTVTVSS